MGDEEKHHLILDIDVDYDIDIAYVFVQKVKEKQHLLDIILDLVLLIFSFTSCRSFLIGTRSTKHQKGFPGID